MTASSFEKTSLNQVRQVSKRGHYDHETVYQILDQNLIGQVAFVSDQQPIIIPMLFARRNDELLFHGSTKSRLMRVLCSGEPICVSATILDGLVMAKSLFHHSMNYRSVTVFGSGYEVEDKEEHMEALRIISEKTMPGRWDDARQPNAQEIKATCIAAIKIESASVKIRTGAPSDAPEDFDLPVWSGVIPISQSAGDPIRGEQGSQNLELPDYLKSWRSDFNNQNGVVHENINQ